MRAISRQRNLERSNLLIFYQLYQFPLILMFLIEIQNIFLTYYNIPLSDNNFLDNLTICS